MSRPFIPAPNTVSLELIYGYNTGTVMENVIHVEKGAPFTLAEIQGLRAAVIACWSAGLKNAFDSAQTLNRVRIRALDSAVAPTEDYSLPTPLPGGLSSGGNMPTVNCVAVKLGTGLTGRSNRGRIYIPVLGTNALDTNRNELYASVAVTIVAALEQLRAAIPAWDATARWVITSFRNEYAWRTVAVNNTVTTIVLVDRHLDSQRRRLTGRGI